MSDDWKKRALAAETTVTVLKKRVRALYDGDGASAIQRQVERAQKRQEEASRRRELMEVRAAELAKYSRSLETQVAERTRELRTILDNVTTGFLLVDETLRIAPGHTRSCETLLASDGLVGTDVTTVLCAGDERGAMTLELALSQVFSDVLPEDVALDAVPKRHVVRGRPLHFDARLVRSVEGTPMHLLLTLTDVTSLEQAQRDAHTNRVLVSILKQRDTFRSFVSDTRELLGAAREAVHRRDEPFYRRALHTVKGNAAAFDLDEVTETVHGVEAKDEVTEEDVDQVVDSLRGFLRAHSEVLDLSYDDTSETSFEVTERSVAELVSYTRPEHEEVRAWAARLALKRADGILGPIHGYVARLAERLDKKVAFSVLGGETLVDARTFRPVARNLVHLLRNAVDHGIEGRDERGSKPELGHIEVQISDTGSEWRIEVADDGRGIDAERLVARAIQCGHLTAEAAARLDVDARFALIFEDGISTADQVSDVSGRGVGMAAVKAAVLDAGGTIHVTSSGEGTRMIIEVPKPDVLRRRSPLAKVA